MGSALPANALAASRPGLVIDGRDDTALEGALLELSVQDNADGLSRCEALFNNWGPGGGGTGYLHFDRSRFDFGKGLQVRLGSDTVFDGRISALLGEFPKWGSPMMRVLAEDRLQDLRMTRRTRSFADSSDSDAIGRIVRDHGLTLRSDLAGPTHKLLVQLNQSDLAFIRDRARANGAAVWLAGSELHIAPRQAVSQGTLTLVHGARLREFSVAADLAGQASRFVVSGWDVAAKSALEGEADDAVLGGELGNDESGAALLKAAFGERAQTWAHAMPTASDEARAVAAAAFRTQARRFVVGRGVAEADATLRVGATVDLQGLGPLFSGRYWVAETCLRFDGAQGLRIEFVAERPGLGRPGGGH
jgi:phage protein D